jgi:hypothetical protein
MHIVHLYSFVPYILSAEPRGEREIHMCAGGNPGVSRFGQFHMHTHCLQQRGISGHEYRPTVDCITYTRMYIHIVSIVCSLPMGIFELRSIGPCCRSGLLITSGARHRQLTTTLAWSFPHQPCPTPRCHLFRTTDHLATWTRQVPGQSKFSACCMQGARLS